MRDELPENAPLWNSTVDFAAFMRL